jgi:hypothetical protein
MPGQRFIRGIAVATALVLTSSCAATTINVAPQAPPAPTTADFYGSYEIILPGADSGLPGSEMVGVWSETGLTIEQMGSEIIQTQMSLGANPGTMEIWDDEDSNPLCAAKGSYFYEDDGRTITLTLISDGCDGRVSSADGAQLIRLE